MQREYKRHGFFCFSDSKNRGLWCLKHGEVEINTVCRILEVSRRAITTKAEGAKVVLSGIIADSTAKLPFVSWAEREELVTDKIMLIENAYVKKWKGLTTLYIGKNTKLLDTDIDLPSRSEFSKPKRRTIAEIIGCEGAFDVIVEGDIVFSGEEREKILDDGTGALLLALESERWADIGFGTPIKARGNVVESERGYVLIANAVAIKSEKIVMAEIKNFLCKYT